MMKSLSNPIICAIDTQDISFAENLASSLEGRVATIKLGLEFFTLFGIDGVKKVTRGGEIPLFLDLKFHDIPNTVAGAVRSAIACNPFMLTVHASGGYEMIKSAVEAAREESAKKSQNCPKIIAVTILTSLEQKNLDEIGFGNDVDNQVLQLAKLAYKAGADGCVSSGHELQILRKEFGDSFTYVVPGIRLEAKSDDQKRIISPAQAVKDGASYIVIGREITQSENPIATVEKIMNNLQSI